MYEKKVFQNIISYMLMLTGAVLFAVSLYSFAKVSELYIPQSENAETDMAASEKISAKWFSVRSDYESGDMVLIIPKLNLEAQVIDGTGKEMLKRGPGLYENSELPVNEDSNVSIAGHRDIYKGLFHDIDKLEAGDRISLVFKGEIFNYKVRDKFITHKNDWDITRPLGYRAVTLTSCYPHYTARERIVVQGVLEEGN